MLLVYTLVKYFCKLESYMKPLRFSDEKLKALIAFVIIFLNHNFYISVKDIVKTVSANCMTGL